MRRVIDCLWFCLGATVVIGVLVLVSAVLERAAR